MLKGHASWAANFMPVAALVVLAFLTRQQSALFRDAMTLYQTTLDKNPNCWMVHNNLGLVLEETGHEQDAIGHYEKSVLLKPDNPEVHNNSVGYCFKKGLLPEAIEQYTQAAINKTSPKPTTGNGSRQNRPPPGSH